MVLVTPCDKSLEEKDENRNQAPKPNREPKQLQPLLVPIQTTFKGHQQHHKSNLLSLVCTRYMRGNKPSRQESCLGF